MWIPKFTYTNAAGGPGTLTLTLPQSPWTRRTEPIGGHRVASSGVPESYTVRRDRLLGLSLRLTEGEFGALEAMIDALQDTAGVTTFFPDADVTTSYAAYLHSPVHGESFAPARAEFSGDLSASIVLRRTTDAPWPMIFF